MRMRFNVLDKVLSIFSTLILRENIRPKDLNLKTFQEKRFFGIRLFLSLLELPGEHTNDKIKLFQRYLKNINIINMNIIPNSYHHGSLFPCLFFFVFVDLELLNCEKLDRIREYVKQHGVQEGKNLK